MISRKLCPRTSKFERSEFFQSFNDFSKKNHLEPSWEPILRVPEQKFWKSAPLKFLFRKYSKKWTENHFFLQKHKNIVALHYYFHFWYSSGIFNANPWNRNFCKISVPQKSPFLHSNSFHTSLQKNATIYLRYLPPCKIRRRIRKSYLFFQENSRSKVRAAQRSKKQQKSMISRIAPTLERPCNRGRVFLDTAPVDS